MSCLFRSGYPVNNMKMLQFVVSTSFSFTSFCSSVETAKSAIMASSTQTGSTNDRAFRVFLFEIAREITTDLLDSLKYLCKDDLPKGELGSIKTAREFLDVLWEGGKIWSGDLNYLTTLLEIAGNIQLANWIRDKGMSFYVL